MLLAGSMGPMRGMVSSTMTLSTCLAHADRLCSQTTFEQDTREKKPCLLRGSDLLLDAGRIAKALRVADVQTVGEIR